MEINSIQDIIASVDLISYWGDFEVNIDEVLIQECHGMYKGRIQN